MEFYRRKGPSRPRAGNGFHGAWLAALLLSVGLLVAGAGDVVAADAADILRVVDGDTIKVSYRGQAETVRLIGIDTPESKANKKAKKDASRSGQDVSRITSLGKEAGRYTRTLVRPGDTVRIEFDVRRRDRYGRLLGYVYLSDGRMLNEEIIKAGYASPMTVPPNVRYQERLLRAYRDARENRRGLWGQDSPA